jgi:pyridoxal/pyridoxine/pyridoxamine kinase
LTPDRVPDLPTALSGVGDVLAAALLAKLLIKAKKLALARPKQI